MKKNPEKVKEIAHRRNLKVRTEVLVAYGGKVPKCACCGETEVMFLGIDHVNGGGTKHREELKRRGTGLYYVLRQQGYPRGFQVLCHNCNLAKGFYGECPHKRK